MPIGIKRLTGYWRGRECVVRRIGVGDGSEAEIFCDGKIKQVALKDIEFKEDGKCIRN